MIYDKVSNSIGERIVRAHPGIKASMLDANNILWKIVNDRWVGKRSVWTFDRRACWLKDTVLENVKSWWSGGIDADYNELFFLNCQ